MLLLMSRCIAFLFVMLAVASTPLLAGAQTSPSTAAPSRPANSTLRQTPVAPSSSAIGAPATQSQPTPDSTAPLPQQIVVTGPPTTTVPWTWHDKVLWGATLVLVILGYIGVLLALRTLKNIQRQTEFGVAAAQAALQCANAALESSQAIVDSGRPWIVVTVEPFLTMENGFKVMATNRGRTPARIVGKADCVKTAVDETQIPAVPDYATGKSSTPFEPIILLPGESAGIRPFRRADTSPARAPAGSQQCGRAKSPGNPEKGSDHIFEQQPVPQEVDDSAGHANRPRQELPWIAVDGDLPDNQQRSYEDDWSEPYRNLQIP